MSEEAVLFDVTDKVLTITLNNPSKLNPIADDMTFPAIDRIEKAVDDPEIGAIVVTGAGRAFCAGGDIGNMGGRNEDGTPKTYEESVDHQRKRHQFPNLLHSVPIVTIAAVNGHAVGAGLGIAASCDLRIASSKGKFGTAFANVGLGGDFGTTWQLTRLLGESKAKEMFFLPDIIDAEEALRIGLVNKVVPAETFEEDVREIASRIAHGPQISYRWMKENVNLSSIVDFNTLLKREAVTHLRCGQTDDHKEGVAAFMEKRSPQFQGR